MNFEEIMELTWVPIIALALSLGYGILLITTKNPATLLSKKNPALPKNGEKYAVEGGKLLLLLAVVSLVNCGLLFVNVYVAFAESLIGLVIFGILWKRMSDQYGPVQ